MRRAFLKVSLVAFFQLQYASAVKEDAWLFLITVHAIKSHRVVASLKSSGARICKPFVKAATRRSWRLSRVISAQYHAARDATPGNFCSDTPGVCFLSVYRGIFYADTLLLYSPHVKSVFRGYEWRISLRERTITFYHWNTWYQIVTYWTWVHEEAHFN